MDIIIYRFLIILVPWRSNYPINDQNIWNIDYSNKNILIDQLMLLEVQLTIIIIILIFSFFNVRNLGNSFNLNS